jgi:hypothetical protein
VDEAASRVDLSFGEIDEVIERCIEAARRRAPSR